MFMDSPSDADAESMDSMQVFPDEAEENEDIQAPWESEVDISATKRTEGDSISEDKDAAEAEAKRKAEKIELLRRRAEEAMARRKEKKNVT
jgi:hypothetical protein